ncbi:MAG: cobalamin B12-binding domain-containing protein [Elusimicrobia bacterium]|nr:cobalamin B12-binding domain-containing protein [Elusimicrobiota bacterium]
MPNPSGPRIVVATTPIRPLPTDYAPVGSLSVLSALNRAGYKNTHFYNIDLLRPSYEQAVRDIAALKPDVFAISAVVSTAYEYTKKLSLDVKRALPGTTVIMGGNLGTSAEILLRKTGIDFIVTGEGERAAVDFMRLWETAPKSREEYRQVKGLAFVDGKGELAVTPYAEPLKPEELYDIDWGILEDLGQLDYFIVPAANSGKLAVTDREDPKIIKVKRDGKTVAMINTCKGCVARCTFCHRWDKGIRYIPVPVLMRRMDEMMRRHNVGFFRMGDENFGSDKRWLSEFLAEIKKRDVLWRVGGMRVNSITPEYIDLMKAAGCVTIFYGMESGSQKMIDVMEKKTTVEQNKRVMKWMVEKDVSTIIQLIVGMPGEDTGTVAETCDFLRYSATLTPDWDPNNVSVNFAQALPGTPLYEVGRRRGLIGQSLDDEEEYLLKISDRDARDGETAINFTEFPRLLLERWHYDLQSAGRFAFIEKFGMEAYKRILAKSALFEEEPDSGYFASPARDRVLESSASTDKLHQQADRSKFSMSRYPSILALIRMRKFNMLPILHPRLFMRLGFISTWIVFINAARKYGVAQIPHMVGEYLSWRVTGLFVRRQGFPRLSLRKMVNENHLPPIPADSPAMESLRAGR